MRRSSQRGGRRPKVWVIIDDGHGMLSVWRGNRPMMTGLQSLGSARNVIKQHRKEHERVWLVDGDDGYRTDLTREFEPA